MFSFIPKILSFVLGSGGQSPVSNNVSNTISSIVDSVGNLYTTDEERQKNHIAIEKIKYQCKVLESEVSKTILTSKKGSWPDALGWICVFCFALYYIPQISFAFYMYASSFISKGLIISFPFDMYQVLELLGAMLGTGIIVHKKRKQIIEGK